MSKIKLFDPYIDNSEKKALVNLLKSNFWASGAGTGQVKKFEDRFSKYVKAKNSVALNSGTVALNLALSMYDLKNKEVILPSLSFVSTANAVVENGGIPNLLILMKLPCVWTLIKFRMQFLKKQKLFYLYILQDYLEIF